MKNTRQHGEKEIRPFGIRDSISYAVGDIGCSFSFALKNLMAIFWTQYMELDLWYSALLIVVQIADAIADPLIGSMIDADRREYRRNKFLVYMGFGSVGLAVGGAISFIPVPNAPLLIKMLIFVSGYVIWNAFYTIVNVPYGSLLPLISADPADRASLSAWRSVGAVIGNMLPTLLLPFIIYNEENDLMGKRVFFAAIVMGVLGYFSFRYMTGMTVIREHPAIVTEPRKRMSILMAMKRFFRNRPAVGVTIAAMGMFLAVNGGAAAVTVLFQSYFDNVAASGIVQVMAMLPILFFTPFVRRAVKLGKKELAVFGALVSVLAYALMLVLPITPDGKGMLFYVLCQLLGNLGTGIFGTVSWALMADSIDYGEWKEGVREEGIIFSLHSFFRKLSQGLGPALVLVMMTVLGYVGERGGSQTDAVALRMRYLVAALYLVGSLIQLLGLAVVYNINKKTLTQMNTARRERK
ncbi:MAG: MFS transporter [Clostridia bacterium]|nr:MFS transporter [Clostridia bacterium]